MSDAYRSDRETLGVLREDLRELEKKIARLLSEFEGSTGVPLESVSMGRVALGVLENAHDYRVKVTVRL